MNIQEIINLTPEALLLTIIISAPCVLVSLFIGIAIAIFSATTQIQEQTLSFAPKIVFVYLAIILSASSLGTMLIQFANKCFSAF